MDGVDGKNTRVNVGINAEFFSIFIWEGQKEREGDQKNNLESGKSQHFRVGVSNSNSIEILEFDSSIRCRLRKRLIVILLLYIL